MKKQLLSFLLLSGLMTFNASASDFGGNLYIEDAVIAPGESAVLSIQVDNVIEISGFQLQMTLPTGISYRSWGISEERLPAGASVQDLFVVHRYDSQTLRLACAMNPVAGGSSFTHVRGEVGSIVIVASPNLPQGVYRVEVTGIDVSDPMGHDYEVPSTSFTITVGDATGIETLGAERSDDEAYDLQGRRQKSIEHRQTGILNGQVIYRK